MRNCPRYAALVADRLDLRHRLHQVAFRQAGYFSAAQALGVGYSHQAQKYHVDRGNWVRVDRGLFRLPEWPSSSDDTYVRWSVWSGSRGIVSHASAAEVHDLGDLDAGPVHLTVPGQRSAPPAVVLHVAALADDDVEDRGAFRVTTPRRTVLDLATTEITQEQLDTAVHDAVSTGRVPSSALRRRMDDFGDRAALRLERALVDESGGVS